MQQNDSLFYDDLIWLYSLLPALAYLKILKMSVNCVG